MVNEDKLKYFDLYARAEPTRMLYAVAGQPLQDVRVSFKDWPAMKNAQPLGQMPVLECAAGTLVMSNSIARYVAKRFGLSGKTAWEEALNDMVVEMCIDCYEDIAQKIYYWQIFKRQPEPDNSDMIKREIKERIMMSLKFIEALADKRGTKFIVCNQISLADVWLYSFLEFGLAAFPELMDVTLWVKAFVERVRNTAEMQSYLATRPASPIGV
ncbi:probable glutathione S-transferase 7 [Watersipora subatra]|uniref:probable glutathione S-transferase 7 n=1 Tax=Watersipora subatra TaxID=2589382 RepID=UPI00355BB896